MIDVIERIASQNRGYEKEAFYYIARAIESSHEKIKKREKRKRHISGSELVEEIVDMAKEEYGYLAKTVFNEWRIKTTEDIGEIVFIMVKNGILSAQKSDSKDDFKNLFDFAKVFEKDYNRFDLE